MLLAFANLVRPVEVTVTSTGSLVDGEMIPGEETTETANFIAIPITPAQVKNLPEGDYTAGDMKFYQKAAPRYAKGTVITLNGVAFEVRDIMDRTFEGGFTVYFARRRVA